MGENLSPASLSGISDLTNKRSYRMEDPPLDQLGKLMLRAPVETFLLCNRITPTIR